MKGTYDIRIENARIQFKLTLTRSITVIRGFSGTGKSTLVGLIAEHEENGSTSGVTLISERPCVTLSSKRWKEELEGISGSHVFIDEGQAFIRTEDFAHAIRNSDNYYVLITRDNLSMLPYSVEEILELHSVTSRYPSVRKTYTHTRRMYRVIPHMLDPELVIVEDSNAGFEFIQALCEKSGITCISAHGKGNILSLLRTSDAERILVVADGAAFGPQMQAVYELATRKGAGLFLPESFEWLILKSGVVRDSDVPLVIADPSRYIESQEHLSWERFFTAFLCNRTAGTYLAYDKNRLNPSYLLDRERTLISAQFVQAGIGRASVDDEQTRELET